MGTIHQWAWNQAINANTEQNIPEGWSASGTNGHVRVMECVLLAFGLIADQDTRITVVGTFTGDLSPTWDTMLQVTATAGTYYTPYSLAAPLNNTGAYVITRPIIKIMLKNVTGTNQTYCRFYAKAW